MLDENIQHYLPEEVPDHFVHSKPFKQNRACTYRRACRLVVYPERLYFFSLISSLSWIPSSSNAEYTISRS